MSSSPYKEWGCEYIANANLLMRSSRGLSHHQQMHPTIQQLADAFQEAACITLYVGMANGGGLSCTAGLLKWIQGIGVANRIRAFLTGFFPLGNLPISSTPFKRLNWLRSRFPLADFTIAEATNARLLSQYQSLPELTRRAEDAPDLDAGPVHQREPHRIAVPGLMVLGIGSSVGKGTTAFILGSIFKACGQSPVPFKATACMESRHDGFQVQRCPSTLMQWSHWTEGELNLPSFLNPVLVTPTAERGADGQASVYALGADEERECEGYGLADLYSEGNWQRLNGVFTTAFERTAHFLSHTNGVLIAEGAGSPLEMACRWDFANEYPRAALGLASLLVTSNDNRGYFSLQGTLEEIQARRLQSVEGIIVCETTPNPSICSGYCMKGHIKAACLKYGVRYLGSIPYIPPLRTSYSEDYLPPMLSRRIVEDTLHLDVTRITTLDVEGLKHLAFQRQE